MKPPSPKNVDEALKYFQKACVKFGDDSPACQAAHKNEETIKITKKITRKK
jgi:hypothetical protein